MSKALSVAGHSLVSVQENLIDAIWQDRPSRPSTALVTLGLAFTGECPLGAQISSEMLMKAKKRV